MKSKIILYDAESILNSWINGNKLMVFLSHYCDPVGGFLSDNKTSFSFGEIDLNKFEYVNHFDLKDT